LGPYDIAGASRLTDDTLYVGKLIQDPNNSWVFLAFINKDEHGEFVGALTDPAAVHWAGETLVVEHSSSPASLVR
jgi:beta-fructofuranosidase